MAFDPDFVDYYEVLEASPNASTMTLERTFRFLAKHHHPDSNESGDPKTFSMLVEAYETLTNSESRAEYDIEYAEHQRQNSALAEETGHLSSDNADRHRLLSLFYAQRRRDMRNPGIGPNSLEQMMGLTEEVLDFHLWFFREKGWVKREENGQLAITADGVEKVESNSLAGEVEKLKRITQANETSAAQSVVPSV